MLFVFVLLADSRHVIEVVSPLVRRDGFCVSNRDQSVYWQSHFLSFYADTALGLLLYVITTYCRGPLSEDNVRVYKDQVIAVFGHGLAHAYLGFYEGDPTRDHVANEILSENISFTAVLVLMIFYGGFMKSMTGDTPLWKTLLITVAVTWVHIEFVPKRYAFTYVQTVMITGGLVQSVQDSDNPFYNSESLMVSLPIALVPWIELLACDDFLIHIGGHVWFDISIPLCCIIHLWYMQSVAPKAKTD